MGHHHHPTFEHFELELDIVVTLVQFVVANHKFRFWKLSGMFLMDQWHYNVLICRKLLNASPAGLVFIDPAWEEDSKYKQRIYLHINCCLVDSHFMLRLNQEEITIKPVNIRPIQTILRHSTHCNFSRSAVYAEFATYLWTRQLIKCL